LIAHLILLSTGSELDLQLVVKAQQVAYKHVTGVPEKAIFCSVREYY